MGPELCISIYADHNEIDVLIIQPSFRIRLMGCLGHTVFLRVLHGLAIGRSRGFVPLLIVGETDKSSRIGAKFLSEVFVNFSFETAISAQILPAFIDSGTKTGRPCKAPVPVSTNSCILWRSLNGIKQANL